MDSQFVRLLLISTIVGQIWSFPLGCSYNETVYKEEEIVKTNDPCLSCICRRGSLMCNLLVCIDPPDNPSPGCFVVHKANECCPQVFCQDSYKQNIVEVRTPFKSDNKTNNKNDCHVNGSTYAEGSAMTSSQLCEYCYCLGGEMKCIKPHCFFQIEGCRPVYQKSSCCPTYYDCRDVKVNISGVLKKNSVKTYPKILNFIKYQRNETTDKKLLKVSRELIRNSQTSRYLGQSEHQTILPESNNFTLTSKRKVNDEKEQLKKEKKNVENSASFGSVMGTESEDLSKVTTEIIVESRKVENLKTRNPHELIEERNMEDSQIASDEIFTNSTEINNDYDIYDYDDLKLPPSLPNLVIFPFVAADAVITNHGTANFEKREQNGLKTVNTDGFLSPITSQGEFQSKEFQIPGMIPIKNSDFKNDQMFRPPVSFAEDSKMEPQIISPEVKKDSNSSELLNDEQSVVGSSVYFNSDFNKLGKTNRVSIISLMEDPKPFDGNQEQTIKPLTVTYKNVVVDYYPEFLITSTRNTAKLVADEITVSENHQKPLTVSDSVISKTGSSFPPEFVENIQTKAAINDFRSDSLSDVMGMRPTSLEDKTLVDTTTLKFPVTPVTPFPLSISTTTESFLLNGVVKNSIEERVKSVTTSRHKYSSKTKTQAMSKPTKGDVLEESVIQPNAYNTTTTIKEEKGKEIIKSPVSTTNTIESSIGENKDIQILELKGESGERNGERIPVDGFEDSSSHPNNKTESVKQLQPNTGNFLKIAGCNIYGRMYRVGKIIPELSEPCLECVCTDVGVQCIPSHC